MGTKLKELAVRKEIAIEDLGGKKLVIDSFNVLYQFLSSIRARDGTLLTDSHGHVTSHLVGLFTRTAKMLELGIRPAFAFDGTPPKLKERENIRRSELKEAAEAKFRKAKEEENVEEMRKYSQRATRLTGDMVREAKLLIEAMGLPVIQAPSEGEAQAAHIVNNGDAYAEVSQDYDCLLFGVKRLIQNLTISEKRKLPGRLGYEKVVPQMIEVGETLKSLGIDQEQLIVIGILVGTDYNIGGIKGIGPKNALKMVKKHGRNFDALFEEAGWEKNFDFSWREVFDLIKHMPVTDDYSMEWKPVNPHKIKSLLCDRHDFSEDRVDSTLSKLLKENSRRQQKGLGAWFK